MEPPVGLTKQSQDRPICVLGRTVFALFAAATDDLEGGGDGWSPLVTFMSLQADEQEQSLH